MAEKAAAEHAAAEEAVAERAAAERVAPEGFRAFPSLSSRIGPDLVTDAESAPCENGCGRFKACSDVSARSVARTVSGTH